MMGTIHIPATATKAMTPKFAGNRTRNVIIATGAISIHDAKNGAYMPLPVSGTSSSGARRTAAIDGADLKLERVAFPSSCAQTARRQKAGSPGSLPTSRENAVY
jgi:hypothetical protein